MGEYDFPKTSANNKFFISEANVLANQLALFGDGSDGNVTISSNTDMAATGAKNYDNLTIDSTFNLYNDSATKMILFIRNTLTLNGTIHMDSKGTPAVAPTQGGNGGAGGGAIIIFANKIVGNGTISADGGNGTTGANGGGGGAGTASTGYFNLVDGYGATAGDGGDQYSGGGAGGSCATAGGNGSAGTEGGAAPGGTAYVPVYHKSIFNTIANATSFRAQAGSSGGYGNNANQTAGGGGGAGGIIIIVCRNMTGTPTITATGGNGGNGNPNLVNGGGGGGAGGLFIYIANKTLTATLTGGTVGTGGTGGANGTAGVTLGINTQA
mgnify:CR=1 FL=1